MTKVEINGKTYCVETLIYTVERLTKDVKASAEYHRLVLEQIRDELLNKAYRNFDEHINDYTDEVIDLDDALDIIDKYR